MSETAILTVTGLTAGYDGGASVAVADVSFTLHRGEILCLVGESGCGKSTLLRALLGVTPKLRIRSGSVRLVWPLMAKGTSFASASISWARSSWRMGWSG